MTSAPDDMDLLRQWRAGDRQAGDMLIRRHYGYALGIANGNMNQPFGSVPTRMPRSKRPRRR